MAYDEELAGRVEELLAEEPGMTRIRMFGGLAWLLRGNLAVVVRREGGLMVRVDPADHDEMLAEEGTAPMIMRGRPMRGWITVTRQSCAAPADLAAWVRRGLTHAGTLPAK